MRRGIVRVDVQLIGQLLFEGAVRVVGFDADADGIKLLVEGDRVPETPDAPDDAAPELLCTITQRARDFAFVLKPPPAAPTSVTVEPTAPLSGGDLARAVLES